MLPLYTEAELAVGFRRSAIKVLVESGFGMDNGVSGRELPVEAGSRSHCVIDFNNAPVAQLDRAADFESVGREFESPQARHSFRWFASSVLYAPRDLIRGFSASLLNGATAVPPSRPSPGDARLPPTRRRSRNTPRSQLRCIAARRRDKSPGLA
jgi:hypothetical protein